MVQLPWRQANGSWHYPLLVESMREAGLEGMGVYIDRRKNNVAQFITTRYILELCM